MQENSVNSLFEQNCFELGSVSSIAIKTILDHFRLSSTGCRSVFSFSITVSIFRINKVSPAVRYLKEKSPAPEQSSFYIISDHRTYASRFTIINDNDAIAAARKNYILWIIAVSVLFCMAAAFFYYKTVLDVGYRNEQIFQSTTDASAGKNSTPQEWEFKFYNPIPLIEGLRKQSSKTPSEFACEESQPHLQSIPSTMIDQVFRHDFENIQDYISLDLLLHYDNIINELPPKYLKPIFNEYYSEWFSVRNSRDFVNFLGVLKSNKFEYYVDYLKHERVDLEIKWFRSYFGLTEEMNHWYNYLSRLGSFLSSYEQQKFGKYLENCTNKNFAKYVEETQKRIFHFVYPFNFTEKKLAEVNEIINEWASAREIKFFNSSIAFQKRIIVLSSIKEQLLRLDKSRLKSVFIFATEAIYLDEDIQMAGINLVIISPKWIFLKKIKIDINGIVGEDITDIQDQNEDGKPGNPGGNAGDFLGVGNLSEKFLMISANGGTGGEGQNGTNGHNGTDNTYPAPPVETPTACTFKINSFNDSFRQKITHYEIYSAEGCGSPGTNGGVGGIGGEGGLVTLISVDGIKVRRGLRGSSGLPGKGGAGGFGGRNGCFYEALDVDDKVLHRITRVQCPKGNVLPRGEMGKDNYNKRGQILPPPKEKLKIGDSIFKFIRVAGEDFIKYSDVEVVSFLKELNQRVLGQYEDITDIISEYKYIKDLGRIEFLNVFKEKITKYMVQFSNSASQPILKLLKSIVLGEMTVLKNNINYFFIDFKNYLNTLKENIKNTNENTREFQSIAYLKQKVETKLEMIAENLKHIKLTAWSLASNSRDSNYPSEHMNRMKILCIAIRTIDVFYTILSRPPGNIKNFEASDLLEFCPRNATGVGEVSYHSTNLSKEEINVFRALENLANENERGTERHLIMLKNALSAMKESEVLFDGGKNLLQALTDELEHFTALYYFMEWEEMANLFFKSLVNLTESPSTTEDKHIHFLKSRLVDVMITLQYKLALDAAQQHLNYITNSNSRLHLLQKYSTVEDVSAQISHLQHLVDQDMDSFCKNHLKAVFERGSAVGEFYFWSNEDLINELQNLFSGAEIKLKSKLINRHVFDKNYVQFTSIKLEFECFRNESVCRKQIHEVLSNFKVRITHSGYSYYNWKGETHIVVSEKVSLEYSFRTQDNGKPEVYNALFKKCQDGEIKLSPFTTWSVRLLPINDDADFNKLSTFAQAVNLRLIGTGTYIS